jgi:hypothetical protein
MGSSATDFSGDATAWFSGDVRMEGVSAAVLHVRCRQRKSHEDDESDSFVGTVFFFWFCLL